MGQDKDSLTGKATCAHKANKEFIHYLPSAGKCSAWKSGLDSSHKEVTWEDRYRHPKHPVLPPSYP